MNMTQRSELIEALESRGFKPGKPQNYGWTFTHKEDGFTLEFDASGKFSFIIMGPALSTTNRGVMTQPSDVLTLIDKAAEAL